MPNDNIKDELIKLEDSQVLCVNNKTCAKMLGVTPRTLDQWRYLGKSPEYMKLDPSSRNSMILYPVEGIKQWIEEHMVREPRKYE